MVDIPCTYCFLMTRRQNHRGMQTHKTKSPLSVWQGIGSLELRYFPLSLSSEIDLNRLIARSLNYVGNVTSPELKV